MIPAAEIEKMSLDERLQTMELHWTSLARTSTSPASMHWDMVRVKNLSKASLPQRLRALLKTL
jgi:hypothetical protein